METRKVNILAFGPHPDDVEIGCGGALLKLKSQGYSTGVVDLTRGEMGSGGDVETRKRECDDAAQILKLDFRENAELPDLQVKDTHENRLLVASMIRKYKPDVILAPYYELPPGRGLGHTDHIEAGLLVSHANNFAHLQKLPIEGEPWFASAVFYYFLPNNVQPSFIVDITEHFDDYIASIFAHKSQFGDPKQNWHIRDFFESRARTWGRFAGATFAQAFLSLFPLNVQDVMDLRPDYKPLKDHKG